MKTMRERFDEQFQVSIGKNHNDTSQECFPCEGGYCQMSPEKIKDFIEQELTKKDQEHKAELESIFNKVRNYLKGLDSVPWNEEVDRFIYSLSKISEQKTILDSHINNH